MLKLQSSGGHGDGQAYVSYVGSGSAPYLATCGADGRTVLRDSSVLEPEFNCKTDAGTANVIATSDSLVAVGDEQYVKVRGRARWAPDRTHHMCPWAGTMQLSLQ